MLTYHLVKVARWIRTGGFAPELAPDRWDGYEYLPYGGDALWAWAMLPFHSDAPLAVASVLVWLAALVSAFALARELGASVRSASLGALALLLNPASASFLASAYVENTSLFFFLAGSLFTVRVLTESAQPVEPVLAAGASGLGAGVKSFGLPVLVLALGAMAFAFVRHSGPAHRVRPGSYRLRGLRRVVPYVRAYSERGSPLYPLPLSVAGRTLVAGHAMTREVLEGTLDEKLGNFSSNRFLHDLFVRRPDRDFHNPGWGGVVLAVLGATGLATLSRRGAFGISAFLTAEAVLTLALLFSPSAIAMRTYWAMIIGRFMLPALGVCAVLAAASNWALVRFGLAAAALLGAWGALPHGFSAEDGAAMAKIAGVLAAGAALAGIAASLAARKAAPVASVLAGTAVMLVAAGLWGAIRAQTRPLIWKAANEGRAYDLDPFTPWGSAHVLWEALDDGISRRIAVSAGWVSPGDNWFRYPYFGRRLQNDVVYIPITVDGSIVDTRDAPSSPRLSRDGWLSRLVEQRIDVLVLLAPEPPEGRWVRELPSVFAPLALSREGANAAFQVNAVAASRAARDGR